MKEMDILGVNRFETYSKTRIGCRGIVIQDGKLLVSREEISDYWMLPGGGLENGETLSECCAREVLEETGYLVEPIEEFLVMNEYYEEYRYISHFFINPKLLCVLDEIGKVFILISRIRFNRFCKQLVIQFGAIFEAIADRAFLIVD